MNQPLLTVFTPAFNRQHTLRRLYESLKSQTNQCFIWLIVDDGSTDGTETLIGSFIEEGAVQIEYHKQKNAGKYVAHNKGVRLCSTELFVCVDSDDELYSNAIERTVYCWKSREALERIAGIVSPKEMKGRSYFKQEASVSTLMDLYNRGQLLGETMLVFRSDVLKQYLFPEIVGENFMSEAVIYDQIDQEYQLVTQNEYLYKAEYLQDGLTKNITDVRWNNPRCTLILYKTEAAYQNNFLKAAKSYGAYLAWKKVRGLQVYETNKPIKPMVCVIGTLLCLHYQRLFAAELQKRSQ